MAENGRRLWEEKKLAKAFLEACVGIACGRVARIRLEHLWQSILDHNSCQWMPKKSCEESSLKLVLDTNFGLEIGARLVARFFDVISLATR